MWKLLQTHLRSIEFKVIQENKKKVTNVNAKTNIEREILLRSQSHFFKNPNMQTKM